MWDLVKDFEDGHNSFKTKCKSSYETVISEATYFTDSIKNFFSNNGEAAGIKSMYESIKEDMISDSPKVISCVDINIGSSMYKEYVEGMVKFIDDFKNAIMENKADELSKLKEQLSVAKNNDSIFVESIYGGQLNSIKETRLDDAICNIEYLIEFNDDISNMINECTAIHESFESIDDSEDKDSLIEAANLLYESIDNFSFKTLNNIFKTYCSINDSLSSPVAEPLTKEPVYKLF